MKITSIWTYRATMLRWVDGDSFHAEVDLGFYIKVTMPFRLIGSRGGVDAYEKNDKDEAKRVLAVAGWERAQELIPVGANFYLESDRAKGADPKDGFGRWLCQATSMDGENIGDCLSEEALAVPYRR